MRYSIDVTDKQIERLREIASAYGLTIGRGPKASEGSLRQLNAAIADGRLLVVPAPPKQDRA